MMKIPFTLCCLSLFQGVRVNAFVVVDPSWLPEGRARRNSRLGYIDDESKASEAFLLDCIPMIDAADLRIRQHYEVWRYKYAKPADESRYLIFKSHFLEQQAWNERNGENHELNDFADMSEAEYLEFLQCSVLMTPKKAYDYAVLDPPMQGRYLESVPIHEDRYISGLVSGNSNHHSQQAKQNDGELLFLKAHIDYVKTIGAKCLLAVKRWWLEYGKNI